MEPDIDVNFVTYCNIYYFFIGTKVAYVTLRYSGWVLNNED